jgi:hypothetical protein
VMHNCAIYNDRGMSLMTQSVRNMTRLLRVIGTPGVAQGS